MDQSYTMMSVGAVRTEPPFSDLFPAKPATVDAVSRDMTENGFDVSQPIVTWGSRNVVIDGHTRLMAARELGLAEVPVVAFEFVDEDEALSYAIARQRDRRNLSDAELLSCVAVLDKRKSHGGDRKSEDFKAQDCALKSASETASQLGISERKVEQVRTVLDHADAPTRKAVLAGEKSVNRAYVETQERRHEEATRTPSEKPVFNRTNENVDWAWWTWNPVTGCKHDCTYCYARDIAMRFDGSFEPKFRPERLAAPANTRISVGADLPWSRMVFVCSMADLFGEWVPDEWINAVLDAEANAPDWTFLHLTKNPARLASVSWPENAWAGTTVDCQSRVSAAEAAMPNVQASVRFLSAEPLLEPLVFSDLSWCDWAIIGGQSRSSRAPEFQPEWQWVEGLIAQARHVNARVYLKPNLTVRAREVPSGR